jgi:benzylsuccinate CoA-transferase BbsF subunit
MGNADPFFAPHNVYPCWGVDRWLAIAVETDEEFAALAAVIGKAELAADPRFVDAGARKRNEAELDAVISDWTRVRDRDLIGEQLCRAGVAAAPSRNAEDLMHDPHLRARGAFVEVEHPEMGRREFVGVPWKMSGCEVTAAAAPLLGEDNDYVFGGILGMEGAEVERLREDGVIC